MTEPFGHRKFLTAETLRKAGRPHGWPLRINDRRENCEREPEPCPKQQ